jgi:chromate transporter
MVNMVNEPLLQAIGTQHCSVSIFPVWLAAKRDGAPHHGKRDSGDVTRIWPLELRTDMSLNLPQAEPQTGAQSGPSFAEALRVWTRIGVTSFGGPAGQIALMHKILVDEKKWLDERTYLLALNFCTLLPGPEAMQLATYSGWRLHGVKGGLAAGLLFVLPGAALILVLSMLYAAFGSVPAVTALFTGIKAAVLAIVVEALLRISKKSLKDQTEYGIAALSFAAIFFLHVPFPVIVFAAGVVGFLRGLGGQPETQAVAPVPVPVTQTLATIALWLAIWIVPLAVVAMIFGGDHVLAKLALFFSKLAVVTFGGAYAVLAYMAQDAVQIYGWLKPGEMLDGLGLAETTPGPLILVTEFVGYLAAYRQGGGSPIVMGVLGAFVTLWATFAPCFLYIFAGAPYIEWLKSAPRLKSALSAITAAVVGVVLNLSVWFALHVIFRHVGDMTWGALRVPIPDVASLDWVAAALALLAAGLLFRLHAGVTTVLGVCGALALAAGQLL